MRIVVQVALQVIGMKNRTCGFVDLKVPEAGMRVGGSRRFVCRPVRLRQEFLCFAIGALFGRVMLMLAI